MTAVATRPVQLLVCGNTDRCDDGAALWATLDLIDGLPPTDLPEFNVRRCGALDIEDLLEVPAETLVVIADAATGVRPGRVVTITFDELLDKPHGPVPHSSHTLPIDQVIGIARALNGVAVDGVFVGIGGSDFGFGPVPSTVVRHALPELAAAIQAAIQRLAQQPIKTGA